MSLWVVPWGTGCEKNLAFSFLRGLREERNKRRS